MRTDAPPATLLELLRLAHRRGGPLERLMLTATHRLRVFTVDHLSEKEAFLLRALVLTRQLQRQTAVLRLPDITAPLCVWPSGVRHLDLAAVAYAARRRWRRAPRCRVTFYRATRRALRIWGGVGGELRHSMQLAHDIGLASVYAVFCRREPAAAAAWVSEDLYRAFWHPRPGEKIPDALLIDRSGQPVRAIELAGLYRRSRLEAIVQHCIANELPFEIW